MKQNKEILYPGTPGTGDGEKTTYHTQNKIKVYVFKNETSKFLLSPLSVPMPRFINLLAKKASWLAGWAPLENMQPVDSTSHPQYVSNQSSP